MKITTVGIDLAKSVFQIHGVDERGKVVLRKQLKRSEMVTFFANLPCLIGMEACASAHHWARKLIALGHEVRLPAPKDSPAQLMPPNDGRRPDDDDRIAPIEESGEQREADTSYVVHASGFDAALKIPRELSTQSQILSSDRAGQAKERDDQPQEVRGYPDDPARRLQHVLIMPESARVGRARTPKYRRRELLRSTGPMAPQPSPENTVGRTKRRPSRAALVDRQLMSPSDELDLQRDAGSKQCAKRAQECTDHGRHSAAPQLDHRNR